MHLSVERTNPRVDSSLHQTPAYQLYLSTVSVWKVLVKVGLGKLPLSQASERILPEQRERHGVATLPFKEHAIFYFSLCLASLHFIGARLIAC